MALSQEIKQRASNYADNGNWFKLALLIVQFGIELIQYLKNRKKDHESTSKQSEPIQEDKG